MARRGEGADLDALEVTSRLYATEEKLSPTHLIREADGLANSGATRVALKGH